MSLSFEWAPLLPAIYYALLGFLAAALIIVAVFKRLGDFAGRVLLCLFLGLLLMNPVFLSEVRRGLPDKLLIIVDDSESQKVGGRDKTAEAALRHITAQAEKMPGIETVVVQGSSDASFSAGGSTNVFSVLRNQMMNIPADQVAATVLITDGQVHDVPGEPGVLDKLRPYHVILTGRKDEFDRKLTVVNAPKYGVLGDDISIAVRLDEFGSGSGGSALLSVYQDGSLKEERNIQPGELLNFSFKMEHAGQNVFEFSIPAEEKELTASNNKAPVIINAVRDRLRVLLISGAPHMGERAWRNLLKSDPAIDLVHFTILRSPLAIDPTPQHELSLIAFPVEELFQRRIESFDLIIFDRYQQYTMLLPHYFTNIANYIQGGGAFLMAMSTDEQAREGMHSSLADILPVAPGADEGRIIQESYLPKLSPEGLRHPVTAELARQGRDKAWGRWQTQGEILPGPQAEVLMTGAGDNPLLVLGKAGEGRIAVLASDNIWLWDKGLEQAGPYTELLRNTAHWLMKEPELESGYIKAEVRENKITVSQRTVGGAESSVLMTDSLGRQQSLTLAPGEEGWAQAVVDAPQPGIYSFESGERKAFAVVGSSRNPEFSDLHTTDEKLLPMVEKTKGSVLWFHDTPDFDLRQVASSAWSFGGHGWIGLRRNEAYAVDSVTSSDLLPDWAGLLILLLLLMGAWRMESGKKSFKNK